MALGRAQTSVALKTWKITTNAATSVQDVAVFEWDPASGTPGIGQGIGFSFKMSDASNNQDEVASLEVVQNNVTHSSEASEFVFNTMVGASLVEVLSVGSQGLVWNESGADLDVKFETNDVANFLTIDGGLNTMAIGAAAVDDQFLKIATPTTTHTATANTYALNVQPGGAQTIPAGTTAYVGSVNIEEPNITATGTVTHAFTLRVGGAPTEGGTSNFALWVDAGATQLDGDLKVGIAGTGHDVTFYGDTSGQYMFWDQSADELVLAGDTKLSFHDAAGGENIIATSDGHLEINAGTTLDITAPTVDLNTATELNIDTNAFDLNCSGAITATGTTVDIDGSGAMQINSSGGAISIANDNVDQNVNLATAGTRTVAIGILDGTDTTTLTTKGTQTHTGSSTVGVDDAGFDVKFFGHAAGAYMEWDASEDQLRIMGASADATTSTGKLLLATSLTDINANDVLGKIDFQAPHEAGGTDAITIAASIQAVAQGTFAADLNATDLIFYTGHSEAATEKFRITSQGELGIGGANYGTDGQVLTSTGAGTAPAWEDVSASSTFSADTVVSNGYGLTVGAAASDRQAVNGVVCETQCLGTGDADSAFAIGRWGNNASSALLYMYKSRGGSIGGAGTVLNDNDRIGQIIFCGDDSTDYQVAAGRIWCEVDVGTVSENVLGGAVCISTNDGGSGSGDTERFRIHANGNFTGSSSADISDSRLKENVATLSGSLAKINQLRGIEFTWKAEAKKDTDKHYGFLAQEVESIIPTVVWDKSVHDITAQAATTYTDGDTIPDGKSIGDVKTAAIEGKAFKSLHYSGLIPVLVEAIKELTARVEALEA